MLEARGFIGLECIASGRRQSSGEAPAWRGPRLLTPFYKEATETSPPAPVPPLSSLHMRTLDITYTPPSRGGTSRDSEEIVPEKLRKLGKAAVWAAAGGQFLDLIWGEGDGSKPQNRPAGHDRSKVEAGSQRLSEAELADLVRRAERQRSHGVSSFSL